MSFRFVEVETVTPDAGGTLVSQQAELRFRCDATVGHGRLETSWTVGELVKTTKLFLADGAVLSFDHPSQRGALVGGDSSRCCDPGPLDPRKVAAGRYRAMLPAYLRDNDPIGDERTALRLHERLAEGLG